MVAVGAVYVCSARGQAEPVVVLMVAAVVVALAVRRVVIVVATAAIMAAVLAATQELALLHHLLLVEVAAQFVLFGPETLGHFPQLVQEAHNELVHPN